jgi:hypothetical protein
MRTVTVSISDLEYRKFGLKGDKIAFSEFIDVIRRELARQSLEHALDLAEKHGLSKMTMDEIDDEVRAVRANAKNSY